MKVALGMDLFTFSLLMLLRLGFGGIPSGWAGPVQQFKAGGIWLQLIFAVERVLGVDRCWMSLAPCNFLILVMFCKDNTSKDPFSRCEICKNLGYRLS